MRAACRRSNSVHQATQQPCIYRLWTLQRSLTCVFKVFSSFKMPQGDHGLVFRMPTHVRKDVHDRALIDEDGVCVSDLSHGVCLQISPNQSGAQGNCTDLPESDQQHALWSTFSVSPGKGKHSSAGASRSSSLIAAETAYLASHEVSSTASCNGIARAAGVAAQA